MTETQDLFEAMISEDDETKRHELTRQYVAKIRAENAEALDRLRKNRLGWGARQWFGQLHALRMEVRWLWIIVGLNTAALVVLTVKLA